MIAAVRLYRNWISPALPGSCRFAPTCSEYALHALEKYGAWKGTRLTIRRLLRCHPFHPGGYDPVPEQAPDSKFQISNSKRDPEICLESGRWNIEFNRSDYHNLEERQ